MRLLYKTFRIGYDDEGSAAVRGQSAQNSRSENFLIQIMTRPRPPFYGWPAADPQCAYGRRDGCEYDKDGYINMNGLTIFGYS